MNSLSHIQRDILKKLLFSKVLRYSNIKPKSLSGSHFKFYLDPLINQKYVTKNEKGYSLTKSGKELANSMDTDKVVFNKHSKITSKLCCIRKVKGKNKILFL